MAHHWHHLAPRQVGNQVRIHSRVTLYMYLAALLFLGSVAPAPPPELRVGSLRASEIAVHVLATVKHQHFRQGRGDYDYFDERLLAGARTWGRDFPSLTYSLGVGNGAGDAEAAKLFDSGSHGDVRCRAAPPARAAAAAADAAELPRRVLCAPGGGARPFAVLQFPNCSGEYYGARGPCCRCQESMRWVLPRLAGASNASAAAAAEDWGDDDAAAGARAPAYKWFVFADDDVYFRAPALVAMLSRLDAETPLALTAAHALRGFAPGMKGHWGWLGEQGCGGPDDCAMAFPWMNVAVVSAAAMRGFRRALDADALTRQCANFKMTHDAGLGLLSWMHATPTVLLGGFNGAPKFMDAKPPASNAQAKALVSAHGLRRRAGAETIGGLEGVSGAKGAHHSFSFLRDMYDALDRDAYAAADDSTNRTSARPVALEVGFDAARVAPTRIDGFASMGFAASAAAAAAAGEDFAVFTPFNCSDVDRTRACHALDKPRKRGGRRRLADASAPSLRDALFVRVQPPRTR